MSGYRHDFEGFGEFLRSPEMIRAMEEAAGDLADMARASAPEQTGEYKASFKVTSGVWPAAGGAGVVAVAHVINDSDHAAEVEYGNSKVRRHRVLGRAAAAFGGRMIGKGD